MKFSPPAFRAALATYGTSQARIATLARVSESDLSKLLRGAWDDTSGAKVTRLVDALNYVERKAATLAGRAPKVWASGDLYDQKHHPEEFDGFAVLDAKGR